MELLCKPLPPFSSWLTSTKLWVKKEQLFIPILQMGKKRLRAVLRPHSEAGQSWAWNTWFWTLHHQPVPGPRLSSETTTPFFLPTASGPGLHFGPTSRQEPGFRLSQRRLPGFLCSSYVTFQQDSQADGGGRLINMKFLSSPPTHQDPSWWILWGWLPKELDLQVDLWHSY